MEEQDRKEFLRNFLENCETKIIDGYVLAALTDAYLAGYWKAEPTEKGKNVPGSAHQNPGERQREEVPCAGVEAISAVRQAEFDGKPEAAQQKETSRELMKRELLDQCDKVLEIRIFDEEKEGKLFRSVISKPFLYRMLDASYEKKCDGSYEEWQYLDIDTTEGVDEKGYVTATGGGRYFLPLPATKDARIGIRYYLGRYKETGQARMEDWRVTGFRCG